jgi:polyphosphate kinase
LSENIRARSIVDQFLEHSRIHVFGPRDEAQVYLSSADWMPRNFHRRVEAMFPIEAPDLRARILDQIVPAYLRDNTKARLLQPDGTHIRPCPMPGEPRHRCQQELLEAAARDTQAAASGPGDAE